MLVLSRNIDEKIRIGEDITIVVVDVQGGKVRLGIEAPRTVPVHREEIYDQVKANNGGNTPSGVIEPIAADLPESELRARYDKWMKGCGWATRPSFCAWLWMSMENRTASGSFIREGNPGYVTFEKWSEEYGCEYTGGDGACTSCDDCE